MAGPTRTRLWVEVGAAGAAWFLALLTLFWRDWIEAIFGVDPDHGNGSLEWAVVGGLALVGLVASLVARREWITGAVSNLKRSCTVRWHCWNEDCGKALTRPRR